MMEQIDTDFITWEDPIEVGVAVVKLASSSLPKYPQKCLP
jgi:hypothetical protein